MAQYSFKKSEMYWQYKNTKANESMQDGAWCRSFPAVAGAAAARAAAASAAVEAASLRIAREGVPSAGTSRAASGEASQVGQADGCAEACQGRDGLAGLRPGLVGRVGS